MKRKSLSITALFLGVSLAFGSAPGSAWAEDGGAMFGNPGENVKPVMKPFEKNKPRRDSKIPSGSVMGESSVLSPPGQVSPRPTEKEENEGVKTAAEIKTQIKQIQRLDEELSAALSEKQELEGRYSEVLKRLNGENQGRMLQEKPKEKIARHKQVAMTLGLIAGNLEESLESRDGTLDAAVKRYRDYQTLEPFEGTVKEVRQLIQKARERKAALPDMIAGTEKSIEERDAAYHAEVEKSLAENSDVLGDVKNTGSKREYLQKLWPDYENQSDVLLPWAHAVPVVTESHEAVIAGLKVAFDFRNGQMDPGIQGAVHAVRAAREESPGREVKLLRPPQVISVFGAYSVARQGFAHFLSVSGGSKTDFVLYETEHPDKGNSKPKKAASFSAYDLTRQMLVESDVNEDKILNAEDADLMISETVTVDSRAGRRGKLADLNKDGLFDRADALRALAAVESGDEGAERAELKAEIEKILSAQKNFLKGIPPIWREVRNVEPVISRENLEALLAGTPTDQAAYLLQAHDYFRLMKTASEAIETLNPGLIAERHPDFFDENGDLKKGLADMIGQAGLAALPRMTLSGDIKTDIPLSDLREFVATLRAEMGEDPAVVFDMRLKESRAAKDSVVESLSAVNETLQAFFNAVPEKEDEAAAKN